MPNCLRLVLIAASPMLIAYGSDAQISTPDEEIYYFHQGQLAAQHLQRNETLSAKQIDKAIEGFTARLKNKPSAYNEAETRQAIEQHHQQRQAQREALSHKNLQAGEAYLASLEADPDYQFLDYGLAYQIRRSGSGNVPATNSQVRIKYIAKHLDGREFDRNNAPDWLSVQGVLPGWRVALSKMPAGSHWTLVVPPHLAYAEHGAGDRIGPHETLIYDIQLLEVR